MHDQNGHQAAEVAERERPKGRKPRPEIDVLMSAVRVAAKDLQDAKDREARVKAEEGQKVAEKAAALDAAEKALGAHLAKVKR